MDSREDYLRAIYELTDKGEGATTTSEVAKKLGVSPASVTQSVEKLEGENLVCRTPYKDFTLSPLGKERGREIFQKYSKLKEFFSKELGLENAEEEADRIEHAISRETLDKMEEFLKTDS